MLADSHTDLQCRAVEHSLSAVPPSTHHRFARVGMGIFERLCRRSGRPHRLAFAHRTFGWSFFPVGGKGREEVDDASRQGRFGR